MSVSDEEIASESLSSQWNGDSDDSDDDLHSSVENTSIKRTPRPVRGKATLQSERLESTSSPGKRETGRASKTTKVAETQRSRTCATKARMSNKLDQGMASSDSQPTVIASTTPQHTSDAPVARPDKASAAAAAQCTDFTDRIEEQDDLAEAVRAANIKALLANTVQAERTTLMPKFLKVRPTHVDSAHEILLHQITTVTLHGTLCTIAMACCTH